MDLNTVEQLIPATGREAVDAFEPGDAWLAGGSALFAWPDPKLRRLVDITALGWRALTATDAGLDIAATCTIAELADYGTHPPPAEWPALAIVRGCCEALRGSFKVWNVGTVGGNICASLPAGPMTSLAAGLGAECLIWQPGGGERRAAVADVVIGDCVNALAPGELLRSIHVPADVLRGRAAIRQGSLTPMGRSASLLIARVPPADLAGEAPAFTLVITAAVARAVTLEFAEVPTPAELDAAIEARLVLGDYFADPHGTPRWRRHLVRLHARELLEELTGA
ncbi:MAG: FAD binding domain-containing protein [Solirubrobacteraceae bacterium]|nr:FAD binding domain-containing protein [Solirubrobacteraceae bacterium]